MRFGIRHEGKRSVQVEAKDGKLIKTHRNDWRINFKGQEYGSFDSENAETPTLNEQAVADKRAEIIVSEANRYRRFADMLKGTHLALSLAFKAASETLFAGETLETINTIKEDAMSDAINISEADIISDSDSLFETIDKAREQLEAVWKKLPEIADSERPHIEERYFNAIGDMDRLLVGERRREFVEKAEGSIYSDEHRRKLALKIPAASLQRLEQYGISRDEFAARTQIDDCSYALESHWIESDAQAIAAVANLDMQTEAGKDEAYRLVAELHGEIIQDLSEAETLIHDAGDIETKYADLPTQADIVHEIRDLAKKDTLTFAESRSLIEGLNEVLGKEGMRDLQNANSDVFKQANIDIDSREALSIAHSYCDAMNQHGYIMDKSEQAILRESQLIDLNEKIEILENERELGEAALQEDLKETETYGH